MSPLFYPLRRRSLAKQSLWISRVSDSHREQESLTIAIGSFHREHEPLTIAYWVSSLSNKRHSRSRLGLSLIRTRGHSLSRLGHSLSNKRHSLSRLGHSLSNMRLSLSINVESDFGVFDLKNAISTWIGGSWRGWLRHSFSGWNETRTRLAAGYIEDLRQNISVCDLRRWRAGWTIQLVCPDGNAAVKGEGDVGSACYPAFAHRDSNRASAGFACPSAGFAFPSEGLTFTSFSRTFF